MNISNFCIIGFLRCITGKKNLLLRNKSKFEYLKKGLLILSFLLFSVIIASAQESRNPGQEEVRKLSLYPNPATSFITFDIQKNHHQKGLTIVVFNFLGKKIAERQSVNEKTLLSLTDFNRGTYIYHLIDPTGRVIDTGKFQVTK